MRPRNCAARRARSLDEHATHKCFAHLQVACSLDSHRNSLRYVVGDGARLLWSAHQFVLPGRMLAVMLIYFL